MYLDGELDPAERETIRVRIENDADWRKQYEKLRRTSAALTGYFRESGDGPLLEDGEDAAVQAIVRESTLVLKRSQMKGLGFLGRITPGTWLVLGLLLALGVAAVAFLLMNDPEPGELLEDVDLNRFLQLDISVDGRLQDMGDLIGSTRVFGDLPGSVQFWLGPDGLMRLKLRDEAVERQAGFDGDRFWHWRADNSFVSVSGAGEKSLSRTALGLRELWDEFEVHMKMWKTDPGDLKLLGEEIPEGGSEPWWKMTAPASDKWPATTLWLNPERELRRVALGGLVIEVSFPRLSSEDFRPGSLFPGLPLR